MCQKFVTGSEAGVCPSCGLAPPGLTRAAQRPEPNAWERAATAVDGSNDPDAIGLPVYASLAVIAAAAGTLVFWLMR